MTRKELYEKCVSCQSGYYVTERGFARTFPEEYEKMKSYPFDADVSGADFKVRLWHYINDMPSVPLTRCGKKRHFWKFRCGYHEFCGANCSCSVQSSNDRRRETSLERYGVDNPTQDKSVAEKISRTRLNFTQERKDEISARTRKTVKERYGDGMGGRIRQSIRAKYGVDSISQLPEFREKAKRTCLERYGTENPMELDEFKEKVKRTKLERYGDENYVNAEKCKQTCLEKYGVPNASMSEEVIERRKQTNFLRYGVECTMHDDACRKRCGDSIRRAKGRRVMKEHPDIIEVRDNTFLVRCDDGCVCGGKFEIPKHLYFQRKRFGIDTCTVRTPVRKVGEMQRSLAEYIRNIYSGEVVENTRRQLGGKEIDIYLPSLRIGFEFNGDYWHATPMAYRYSSPYCENSDMTNADKWDEDMRKRHIADLEGISLYTVWEGEWFGQGEYVRSLVKHIIDNNIHEESAYTKLKRYLDGLPSEFSETSFGVFEYEGVTVRYCEGRYCNSSAIDRNWFLSDDKRVIYCYDFEINDDVKFDILQSHIEHALGLTSERIFARKCTLGVIDNRTAKPFLDRYSLFGHRNASVTLGLFHEDELVMVYSFGHNYYGRKRNTEVIRVCTKSHSMVVGGESRCLKYYLDNFYDAGRDGDIIFYVDRLHQSGRGLVGFEFLRHEFGAMNYWNIDYDDGTMRGRRGTAFSRTPSRHAKIKELVRLGIITQVLTLGVDTYRYSSSS